MNINFKILSSYQENESTCYLCEGNLKEYLENLSSKYDDYDIQRGLVNNFFLEELANTLKNKAFIPPIILVLDTSYNDNKIDKELIVEKGEFNILDGLQRTIRLKNLLEATKFIESYYEELKNINSNFKIRKFFREKNDNKYQTDSDYVIKAFENKLTLEDFNRKQWFEIWNNLNKAKQIEKMIIFNAGHKSMDIKHQLELIFLNSVELNQYNKCTYKEEFENKCKKTKLCITYSKDISTRSFYNKKRKKDIHFTLLIYSIIALEHKKPFKIDQKSIVDLQENYEGYEAIQEIISNDKNISSLIKFFCDLDDIFCKNYSEKGLEFLGRESVIIGLFAAIGKYLKDINNLENDLNKIFNKIKEKIISNYDLEKFEEMKRKVDVTAFNIGNIMKETVYYLTLATLKDKEISFIDFPVNNPREYKKYIEDLKNDN